MSIYNKKKFGQIVQTYKWTNQTWFIYLSIYLG